jgi:ABC-type antimicrobial peptide transport system permease subunit
MTMILGQAMSIAAVGGVIGAALAVLAGRALGGMLYGVTAADPMTYVVCGVVLAAAVLAAAVVPAARAMRVHPMVALRAD